MMDKETWLSAEEAFELGFADTVEKEQKIAASLSGETVSFKGVDITLDNFKAFPAEKFSAHEEKKTILSLKQRHRHKMNMLEARH